MNAIYATVQDISALIRPLTAAESEQAENLLPIASAKLRIEASKHGADIDSMIAESEDYALAVKEIVCKAAVRAIDSSSSSSIGGIASQESQSALGYTASITYVNAGQQLYYLRNELKELGILRQRYGVLDLYGAEEVEHHAALKGD